MEDSSSFAEPLQTPPQHLRRRMEETRPQGMHFSTSNFDSSSNSTNVQPSSSSSSSDGSNSAGALEGVLVIVILFVVTFSLGVLLNWLCQRRARQQQQQQQQEDEQAAANAKVKETAPSPDFAELLQSTTMTVRRQDIQQPTTTPRRSSSTSPRSGSQVTRRSSSRVQRDLEAQNNSSAFLARDGSSSSDFFATTAMTEQNTKLLKIPLKKNKADKDKNSTEDDNVALVPCLCAICLGSFRPKHMVSWSQNQPQNGGSSANDTSTSGCVHAFHTQCLVDYCQTTWTLQQQQEARRRARHPNQASRQTATIACPLCRGPFLTVPNVGQAHRGDDEETGRTPTAGTTTANNNTR